MAVSKRQAEEVIEKCKAIAPLPDGYKMYVDDKTYNVLCCGPNLGFCISEKAMEGGYYRESFARTLEFLIECEADFLKDPTNPIWRVTNIFTIDELTAKNDGTVINGD
jgi:hypothetical protein